jgi:uncharacterized membrane protein
MKTLNSLKFASNVLVPGWIASFGLIALLAPTTSVPVSLAMLVLGLGVVPAFLLIAGTGESKLSPAA